MSGKLYQTSDKTRFYHAQDAKNHALSLTDRKVEEVDDVLATAKSEGKKEKKTAIELIAEIEQVETIDALDAYSEYKQVTVVKAIEAKRESLTANIEVDLGSDEERE